MGLKKNKYRTIDHIPKDAKVGIIQELEAPGGIFDQFFTDTYGSRYQIVPIRDLATMIEYLHDGKVDALFLDIYEADYWLQNGGDRFITIGNPMKVADGIGIMASPKNAALIQQINQQLQIIENNQEYINLYHTYINLK